MRDGIQLGNSKQQLYIVNGRVGNLTRDRTAAVLSINNFVVTVQIFAVVFANFLVDIRNLRNAIIKPVRCTLTGGANIRRGCNIFRLEVIGAITVLNRGLVQECALQTVDHATNRTLAQQVQNFDCGD